MSRYQTSGTKSAISTLNAELEKIATAQEGLLSRLGDSPNQMEDNLDMNSHDILNLPSPSTPTSPVRLQDLEEAVGGDTTNQRLIKKTSPTIIDGQTTLVVSDIPFSLNVFVNGVLLQQSSGDYTYNTSSGLITFPTALTSSDIVEIQYGYIVESTPSGNTGIKMLNTLIAAKGDNSLEVGDYVSTTGYYTENDGGAGVYSVVSFGTGIEDGGEYINADDSSFQLKCISLNDNGRVLVEKFGASTDSSIDSRSAIQAAIEYCQQGALTAERRVLTSNGGTYWIKSVYPDALPTHATGHTFGLWIEDAEYCWIDFAGGRIELEGDNLDVAGITSVIGIVQETGDQAFMNIKNIRIEGGDWTVLANEPDYNLRFDYNVAKYSQYENIVCRNAKISNMQYAGFVLKFNYCDCRFAQEGAGFRALVTSVDGDGATRTGHNYTNCTTDYTGLHGFWMSGGNGHTYCQWVNCNVDHCGRDRDGNTIVANNATAAAYRVSAGFGIEMSACGAETSTRFGRFSGVRSFHIDTAYDTNMGSTDGANPVDYDITIDGFSEECRINGFRKGTYLNGSMKILGVTTPSGFNNTQVSLDYSIPDSEIDVTVTDNDSSAPFLIGRLEDFYERGVRNTGGDAKVVGNPTLGRDSTQWFEQNTHFAEKNFYMRTLGADATQPILTITNAGNDGFLGIELEVRIGGSLGSTIATPSRYIITAAKDTTNFSVTSADKINTSGGNYNLSAAWNGETLELTIQRLNPDTATNYEMTAAVQCTAWGRASSTYQTFDWEEQI